jgi:hypothetical protein
MPILGKYQCGGDTVINTGLAQCDIVLSVFERFQLIPKNTLQTNANVLVYDTFLINAYKNDNPALRYYPFINAVDTQDKSEKGVYQTTANGSKVKIRDGKYALEFKFMGGLKAYQVHKSFDGKQDTFDVQFIDTIGNAVCGTRKKNLSGFDFAGFAIDLIDVSQYTHPTQTTKGEWTVTIELSDNDQFDKNGIVVQFDSTFSVASLFGLRDLDVVQTTLVANVLDVTVNDNGTNLYDAFSTGLGTPAVWKVYNNATNALFTVTSVVATPASKTIKLTLDSTAYTALASGTQLRAVLGPVSALSTALVNGYEGEAFVIITKP